MPIDPFGPDFAYVQIADDLTRRISAGEITWTLPAQHALAEGYGVAFATVRHAMAVLRARGVVKVAPGRGTFVAASLS